MALPAPHLLLALLLACLGWPPEGLAQLSISLSPDSSVYRIDYRPQAEEGGHAAPRLRFSSFQPDRLQVLNAEVDIPSMRIIPEAAADFSTPTALRSQYWEPDPGAPHLFWTRAYAKDSLALLRYDQRHNRLDTFSNHGKSGYLPGKAGIWLSDQREMLLLSRDDGRVLRRKNNPNPGLIMEPRAWGDDLLVAGHLYLVREDRFVPFQPVPDDLQGCISLNDVKYEGECCLSNAYYQNSIAQFITLPGYPTKRLPFKESSQFLTADAPTSWFISAGQLRSFQLDTGDTLSYPSPASEPLRGDPMGRFLGLVHEQGLVFFDKNNCRFGCLDMPFGFSRPKYYLSDQRYVYLSYDDYWEIIQVERLPAAFKPSTILAEFEDMQQAWMAAYRQHENDFYGLYAAFLPIYAKNKALNNPKIEAYWPGILAGMSGNLMWQPDSVSQRVAADFRAGRFLPAAVPDLAMALFLYYGAHDSLEQALQLAAMFPEKVEELNYGAYILQMLQQTQRQLDSLAALPLPPDERLYGLGKIWYDLGVQKIVYHGAHEPRHFQHAYSFYQQLIRDYPDSPLADNATYNQLNWIDYDPQTTDDMTLPGNPHLAYQTFQQFLQDYPHSDCRPEVWLRLAQLLLRGGYNSEDSQALQEEAASYLQALAIEYPAVARQSDTYKSLNGELDRQLWSRRWTLAISASSERYTLADSILIRVRWINRSGKQQLLDSLFLADWSEGLHLHLSLVHEKDCADLFGAFPLLRTSVPAAARDTLVPAQQFYEETFLLAPTSINRNYYPGSFSLQPHAQYRFLLEYQHPRLPWLRQSARGGLLTID